MDKQEHILPLLEDYVLDLLPVNERRQVELHAATCAACRRALQQERRPGELVRSTLAVAELGHGRFTHLMPAIPTAARTPATSRLQRQLALVGLLLVMAFGVIGLRQSHVPQGWPPALPGAVASTATMTHTATSTLVAHTRLVETAVATTGVPTQPARLSPTPAPQPTPIAAIKQLVVDS